MLINDIMGVFKQGKALKDKEVWKSRVALGNALTGVLSGLAGVLYAFGVIHIQLDPDTVQAAAMGLAAMWGIGNSLLHVAVSETAGIPTKSAGVQSVSATANQTPDTTYIG